MTRRQYSNTATEATLTGGIAAADTSFTLTSFSGYPAAPFTATISRGESDEEVVLVTAVSVSTVTATRGYDGTTAKSHAAGASFIHTTVAQDFDEANAHHNASAGVHNVNGSVVGTTDTQTLTNKTLITPTLSGPTLAGTATVASATLSGTLSVVGATVLSTLSTSGLATLASLTVTGASTLAAATLSGLLAANGGITVPTGKKITLIDAPSAGTDGANKTYADAQLAAAKTYADGLGASTATANALVKRDAAGRAQFADPAANADAATKNYVDGKLATTLTALTINGLPSTFAAGANAPGFRKLGTGQVVAEGAVDIANLSFSLGQTICTFPAGARPGVGLSFLCPGPGNGAAVRLDLTTAGVLSYGAAIGTPSTPSAIWLTGIQFYAVN